MSPTGQASLRAGQSMKTSNRKRGGVAALPHCADFRPRHVGGDRADEIVRVLPRLAPVLVFTITAALVALATNLSMHLLNLRMQNLGATETAIDRKSTRLNSS